MATNAIALARTILYAVVALWSFLTFILAAALIGTTEKDFNGYNPASVELLVAAILAMVVLIPLHVIFHRRRPEHIFASSVVELSVLGALWLLFLGGAAAISSDFMGLTCFHSMVCSLSQTLEAFAWLTWITLTGLIVLDLVFMIRGLTTGRKTAWREPFDPAWGAGASGEKGVQGTAAPVAHQSVMGAV